MRASSAPIGFFDSGVGGLSIWKEVNALLPNENTIYLADSLHAPYGEKSKDEIISFSVKNTEYLMQRDCKLIVVACNTATTNAIAHLRTHYQVPFIGIEPATKPAAINTKTGKIGILATKGTLASELFLNTSRQFRGEVDIIETVGTGLVRLIESGNLKGTLPLLHQYLDPMIAAGVDNIVLGCTHYPFLLPIIKEFVPETIQIIDSGAAVARQCKRVLEELDLINEQQREGAHEFLTNAEVKTLNYFVQLIGAKNHRSAKASF